MLQVYQYNSLVDFSLSTITGGLIRIGKLRKLLYCGIKIRQGLWVLAAKSTQLPQGRVQFAMIQATWNCDGLRQPIFYEGYCTGKVETVGRANGYSQGCLTRIVSRFLLEGVSCGHDLRHLLDVTMPQMVGTGELSGFHLEFQKTGQSRARWMIVVQPGERPPQAACIKAFVRNAVSDFREVLSPQRGVAPRALPELRKYIMEE